MELDPKITPRMKQQSAHHTVSTNVFADHLPLIRALQQGAGRREQADDESFPQTIPPPKKERARAKAHAQPEISSQEPTEPEPSPEEQWDDKAAKRLVLRRIVIGAPCKGKALQFLAEHKDITASTIFPNVVGLGRFLRWQFESLRTMLM